MPKPPLSPFLLDPEARPAAAGPCADHAPGPRPVMGLSAAELLLVGAMRAWVAPVMRPGSEHPDWRDLFTLARIPPAGAVAFEALMAILGAQAQRLIDIHCCRCPSLGEDEAAAIRLVAALQRREVLPALDVLGDWLPREAVGPALLAARRLALGMAEAGLPMPRRGEVIPFPAAATLH